MASLGNALGGFAQAFAQARLRKTQMDIDQRHQLAGALISLYPNARPEAQQDIAQRLLTIYSTPANKKLDKNLGDVSTLGRAGAQQNMQAGANAAAAAPAAPPPNPQTGATLPSQVGPTGAPDIPTPAPIAPTSTVRSPIPPPPDLSQASAQYSPFLSPEEHNKMAAATLTATETAKETAALESRRRSAEQAGLQPGTPAYENFVAGRIVSPYAHLQTKYIVGKNGERQQVSFNPLTGETIDSEGNVVENPIGWASTVNATGTSAYKTYYAAAKSSGLSDAEIANDWNTRNAVQHGYRMVPQPDGSIKMVPVTTVSTTSRGQLPEPPGKTKPAGTARPSIGSGGQVVGGKIPPEVAKAQTAYQDSISRFNVMSEALPQALAGNQQAMINLLYNHIGMTVGLQKGARITQDIINEAQQSAPWMATLLARIGVGNEFTMTPTLMRGVTLAPEQMHQMVDLAEGRVEQDYRKFQEERSFFRGGEPQTPEQVISGGRAKQNPKKLPPPPNSSSVVPKGAMHIGTSTKDGKDHYLDAQGKDLGLVSQ